MVPVDERRAVMNNLPAIIGRLTPQARGNALYVSKFITACVVGLFDAALNFLWDETVANLREKVTRFDLAYFYDSLFSDPDRRKEFNDEGDLVQLDDQQLIVGCRNIGILSDIGFRHLNYIRDMRNWASAAHPNQVELTGLQLASWLDTCVREVLAQDPSQPAIEVRQLLTNVRTQVLKAADVVPIAARMNALPPEIVSSLLRAIAGMYSDPGIAANVRNNIRLILPPVWEHAPEQAKRDVGLKYGRFAANADVQRRDAVREFLEIVNGLIFLAPDALALEIAERTQALESAHLGTNNFHNEPIPARMLASSIPESGVIPDVVRADYVRVVTLGHIGNPYGVSWAADSHYQRLIARFGDAEIHEFLRLLRDDLIGSRLRYRAPARRLVAMARQLIDQTRDLYAIEALGVVVQQEDHLDRVAAIGRLAEFRRAFDEIGQRPAR